MGLLGDLDHAQPGAVELVQRYQEELRPFPGLDPIPPAWLHLTMQGVGFLDELDDDQAVKLPDACPRVNARSKPVVTGRKGFQP